MGMNPRLLRPILSGDPDALRYIAAVQAADQQSLEPAVRKAITDFIVGCKADGIWSAIKASCILMGARTLLGALTPLVGPAPTNNGPFVSGDYNRKTGLKGNGSSKYLGSGVTAALTAQNNHSLGVLQTADGQSAVSCLIGGGGIGTAGDGFSQIINVTSSTGIYRNRSTIAQTPAGGTTYSTSTPAITGCSRAASGSATYYSNGFTGSFNDASFAPDSANTIDVFRRTSGNHAACRIGFYWIGESLNMGTLESRATALHTALGAAIP
jgi:hypothetical protein